MVVARSARYGAEWHLGYRLARGASGRPRLRRWRRRRRGNGGKFQRWPGRYGRNDCDGLKRQCRWNGWRRGPIGRGHGQRRPGGRRRSGGGGGRGGGGGGARRRERRRRRPGRGGAGGGG